MGELRTPTLPPPYLAPQYAGRSESSHMTAEPLPNNRTSALSRIWADLVAAGWRESVLRYATHGVLLLVLVAASPRLEPGICRLAGGAGDA